jgi:nucleotide sugar dehydrogenase
MKFKEDQYIKEYMVLETASMEELLGILNKKVNSNFGSGFALIVNSSGKLVGTLEDSDLRKFLSKFSEKDLKIKEIMRTDFISVENGFNQQEVIEKIIMQMNNRGWSTTLPVKIIPVTENGKPVGLLDIEEIDQAIHLKKNRNIVVGLGYVGLTLALSLAQSGRKVFGYDNDKFRVESLNKSYSYILEPGIDTLLRQNINKNFVVKNQITSIINEPGIRNIYFLCVGTPLDSNNIPNVDFIWKAVFELLIVIKKGDAIVMRSTVPIGMGQKIISFIEDKVGWQIGVDFHYISAPERTVEGNALKEIRDLPQIISGATESCQLLGLNIFQNLANSVTPLEKIESSELVKLMGNAYRDYIFGFSNYFIDICQEFNLDINLIIESSNRGYPRSNIPLPSPGVGGPCLTKDSYFLQSPNKDISPIIAARNINVMIPAKAVNFIDKKIKNIADLRCLAIGMAFKGVPETNDFRNSPAVDFLEALKSKVKSINIWDSVLGTENVKLDFPLDALSNEYTMYAILNNNPKNVDYFNSKIKKHAELEVVIYDPWRLLNPNYLVISESIKIIHYLSLSHYERIVI